MGPERRAAVIAGGTRGMGSCCARHTHVFQEWRAPVRVYLASRNFLSKLGRSWFLRLRNHRCTCLSVYPVCLQRLAIEVWGRERKTDLCRESKRECESVSFFFASDIYLCWVFGYFAVVRLQCWDISGLDPCCLFYPEQRSQRRCHRPAIR